MQLKVLLVKDSPERSELLKQSVQTFGHNVVAEVSMDSDLVVSAGQHQPDLLLVDSDSLGDVLLSRLHDLSQHRPLPVVLFTEDDNRRIIQKAVRAGVSAYIVDGLDQHRIGAIMDVAVARFQEGERLRKELHETRASLSERKAVERAKAILMKQRRCEEPEAYHALRKMAMDKNLRIGQAAENVIAVAELLN